MRFSCYQSQTIKLSKCLKSVEKETLECRSDSVQEYLEVVQLLFGCEKADAQKHTLPAGHSQEQRVPWEPGAALQVAGLSKLNFSQTAEGCLCLNRIDKTNIPYPRPLLVLRFVCGLSYCKVSLLVLCPVDPPCPCHTLYQQWPCLSTDACGLALMSEIQKNDVNGSSHYKLL